MDCDSNHEQLNEIIQLLRKHVNIVDMEPPDNSCLLEEGGRPQAQHLHPPSGHTPTTNTAAPLSVWQET